LLNYLSIAALKVIPEKNDGESACQNFW